MIAKLEQRRLNPQSGQGTHVAVKMHVRELAELRSLLTSPVGRNTRDASCLKPAQQFRFLADPNRRKLTANDWGVPSASGWSFAFEATATAARGRQSDGEEGVTHFDLDARMASFDIIEEETKYPDLEPMRIVRHRLKQPESAPFQVRLAPREVVVFVENLPVTRTQAKTAELEPASILVAIVSCEAHTELPDWADPNTIRPPSVGPIRYREASEWSSAMEGTPVESACGRSANLRGQGVNSGPGLRVGLCSRRAATRLPRLFPHRIRPPPAFRLTELGEDRRTRTGSDGGTSIANSKCWREKASTLKRYWKPRPQSAPPTANGCVN